MNSQDKHPYSLQVLGIRTWVSVLDSYAKIRSLYDKHTFLSSKPLQSDPGVFKKCKLLCYNEKNVLIEEYLIEVTDSIKCSIFKNSF